MIRSSHFFGFVAGFLVSHTCLVTAAVIAADDLPCGAFGYDLSPLSHKDLNYSYDKPAPFTLFLRPCASVDDKACLGSSQCLTYNQGGQPQFLPMIGPWNNSAASWSRFDQPVQGITAIFAAGLPCGDKSFYSIITFICVEDGKTPYIFSALQTATCRWLTQVYTDLVCKTGSTSISDRSTQ